MAKVVAETANGYLVSANTTELNKLTGLDVGQYNIGDQLPVNPNLTDSAALALREAKLVQKIYTLKTAIREVENG